VHFFTAIEHHLYMTYLYSRVRCCDGSAGTHLSMDWDVSDPRLVESIRLEARAMGVALHEVDGRIGACDMPSFPRNSSLWTMSARCNNKAFVEDSAQNVKSNMLTTKKMLCLFVAPLVGATSDFFGRARVLQVCAALLVAAMVIYTGDAWAQGGNGEGPVILAGCLMGLALASKHIVIVAAIGSRFGDDSVGKARAFVGLGLVCHLQGFIVESVAYWYLRSHHTTHFAAWVGLTAIACVTLTATFFCFQDESPDESRRYAATPSSSEENLRSSFCDHLRGLSMVIRDPVLLLVACVHALFMFYHVGMLTTHVSYGSLLGVRLEDMVLPGAVVHAVSLIFPVLLTVMMPYLCVWNMLIASHVFHGLGYVFCGPYAVLVDPYESMFFTGLAGSIGHHLCTPAEHTLVSQRAGKQNQGSCQAALVAFGSLGAAIAVPLYNRVLFDATASGLDKARCPMVSLLVAALCSALSCVAKRLDRASEAPAAPAVPQTKGPYMTLLQAGRGPRGKAPQEAEPWVHELEFGPL